jgi:hypothetical protein
MPLEAMPLEAMPLEAMPLEAMPLKVLENEVQLTYSRLCRESDCLASGSKRGCEEGGA